MGKSAFKLHIKKGDTVLVLAGDDKGKTGKVLTVFPEKSRAIVEGLNIVFIGQKRRPLKGFARVFGLGIIGFKHQLIRLSCCDIEHGARGCCFAVPVGVINALAGHQRK